MFTVKKNKIENGHDCWGRSEFDNVYDVYHNNEFVCRMYKDERQKDALGPEVRAKLDKVLATGLTRNSNTVHTKESAAKEKLADEWKKKWEKVK